LAGLPRRAQHAGSASFAAREVPRDRQSGARFAMPPRAPVAAQKHARLDRRMLNTKSAACVRRRFC